MSYYGSVEWCKDRINDLAKRVADLQEKNAALSTRLDKLERRIKEEKAAVDKCVDLLERLTNNVEIWVSLSDALTKLLDILDDNLKTDATWTVGKIKALERVHTCEGCGLPEDGLKVRNITVRPSSGLRLCADCAEVEIPF